jgi:hypothetical protein
MSYGNTTYAVDVDFGDKTREAVLKYWKLLGWESTDSGWNVGSGTRIALAAGRTK